MLNENKKVTLYWESVCPDCLEIKNLLDEANIKFISKCITVDTVNNPQDKMVNTNNRWEFHDFSNQYPEKFKLSPVIVVEDDEFNFEFVSAGYHFDTPKEALTLVEEFIK
tara:strand:+ start:2998 stop:3327 length:330 start_codon:yes stop_codon:yes gene_type:complete